MRNIILIPLLLLLATVLRPHATWADLVTFNNGIPGTMFGQPVGTPPGTLLFNEDGTSVIITSLVSNGSQTYNFCRIEPSLGAPANFYDANIMSLQGIGLIFDFTGEGDVSFEYLHLGGTVNMQVNGFGAIIEEQHFPSMEGFIAPGIFMSATSTAVPGGFKGTVTITGPVQDIRIGGGELYLDDISGGGDPTPSSCDYEVNHQALVMGEAWGSTAGNNTGDIMFNQDAIPVSCETFYFSGSASAFGDCRITSTPVINFGHDKVMRCQDISNQYDIAALGIATAMVSFEFLNDGSMENLQVNGQTLFKDLFENMPSDVAAGVTMTVTSQSAGTGTRGLVVLTGNVETLLVGGRVLYLDNLCVTQGSVSAADDQRARFDVQLDGNFPNPFNPSTTISFSTSSSGTVEVSVVDLAGRLVTTLLSNHLEAGSHQVCWNGNNSSGQQVSTGIYFVQLRSNQSMVSRKIMMIK